MNYSLLVYETATDFAKHTDPDSAKRAAYWSPWQAYAKAVKDAGIFVGGAGMQPPQTATILRRQGGKRQVQEGPFADTQVQLGGMFIIDVPNLDVAMDWAARAPVSADGLVEIRPNVPRPN